MYVTHDQIEAMTMGDRVAVMSKGALMQVDSPQNLYDHPDNLFVAAFIGSPQMNLLRGKYQGQAPAARSTGISTISICQPPEALAGYSGRDVAVGIRPEHLTEATGANGAASTISGTVTVREGLGSEVIVHIGSRRRGRRHRRVRDALEGGTHGRSMVRQAATDDQFARRRHGHCGHTAAQMHLFDLQTGLAIR